MSRRRNRRGIAEFSLSFLDVISCGFGAIILLLIISKTVEPVILERTQIDLDGKIAQREQALHEIRGRITEMRRQVTDADAQLQDNLTQVAALERELTDILGRYATTVSVQEEAKEATQQLAAARQTLTDEMQRLLGVDFRRSTELVGGIAVDSEYIVFVIDTSGSMFNVVWGQVIRKVEETLAIYPNVKGIQVMSDMGAYMFPRFAGEWMPDSPSRRAAITQRLASFNPFSNSSPVEGIEAAIRTFARPDVPMSIYVFGDDFTGRSIEEVIRMVDRINPRDENGRRMVRIHAVGFPVYLQYPSDRLFLFAALMRELAHRNDGTFVGLSQFE
ncbi:MAG: hypothetical protein ACNA7W_14200 [Pseudomonadales bacterium]